MKPLVLGFLPSLGLLAVLAIASPSAQRAPGGQDGPGREVAELIRQLGDKRAAVRAAAARKLLEVEGAVPGLRAALKSPDPEVARRAAQILDEISRRSGRRALAQLAKHAKDGEIDRAVELLVWRPKWDDDNACWQVLTRLAAELIERGRKEFGGTAVLQPDRVLPAGDFGRFVKDVRPIFLSGPRVHPGKQRRIMKGDYNPNEGFVLRGKDLVIDGGDNVGGLLASAGSVHAILLRSSVIYASGPVEISEVRNSLLVCDGDLRVNSISYSLVIARGDIHCSNSGAVGSNSLVITSGRLHLGRFAKVDKGAKVLERQATPLGFVKFFDPDREGIEVEAAKDGVRVKVAAEGKAFAKAGLRAGDVITAVDKEATADPEAFRRQLRSALAREEGPTLRILRAGKAVELKIPAPQ
jgi:hypothetical protein